MTLVSFSFDQVVLNFYTNAIQAIEDNGVLHLSLREISCPRETIFRVRILYPLQLVIDWRRVIIGEVVAKNPGIDIFAYKPFTKFSF